MKRNLVLTTVRGLSPAQMAPFVCSFELFQKDADLIVFTSHLSADTRAFLSKSATELVNFNYLSIRMRHPQCLLWPLWKRVFPLLKSERSRRALARCIFNLFFLRSLLYLDYIESLAEKPRWILLTDSRDAIFQDDVFARIEAPGLYCFGEGKGLTIASCRANSHMVLKCFGEQGLKEVGHFEPSCAGTVLGDYESIHAYLQNMVDYAMTIHTMKMVPGDDQGLHNYIIRKELTPNIKLVDNDTGPIGTMGCVPYKNIRVSPEHLILQGDGKPYAFLHQQDRHKEIVANHPVYKKLRTS
ncbi:MAG: hypothetical protein WCI40_01220 [Verrucomicrobiota bacterium]